ncbi:unnamed protein product [Hymenolepis diminuta]|uniref:Uncharacterized protein n=1 Tax=Hymenolepis diminuta TaxID=6216 RepID=A0A564YA90_HYMDI|nr:unnamed protein product [Hymenolepis diminuta]
MLMGYKYEVKYQRTEDFGQAVGLSCLIENQVGENEEIEVAFVSVERNVQHILAESNRNTPVSAEDIRKETEKDAVQQQTYSWEEVLMGRKLRTVHEAMLPKETPPNRRRGRQKNDFAVNKPVYARDYRLGRQWIPTIITKGMEA